MHGGAPDGDPGRAAVVLLHGAGNGSKERLLPLLAEFVAHGCQGLAFDFSGHGESTGQLSGLSLRRRFEQAVAVIDAQVPADGPLVLVGFSMSGQTVADLAGHYGERVAALGLCAPAVYAAEAWDVPFGDGDGRFSEIIRTAGQLAAGRPRWTCCGRTRGGRCSRCRVRTRDPGGGDGGGQERWPRAPSSRASNSGRRPLAGAWLRDHPETGGSSWTVLTGLGERGWTATRSWVTKQLAELSEGRRVVLERPRTGWRCGQGAGVAKCRVPSGESGHPAAVQRE